MPARTLAILATIAGALILACGSGDSREPLSSPTVRPLATAEGIPDVIEVQIRDLTIVAETAVTPEERGQGLSDRPSLAEDAGMLFFQTEERVPSFHMRNMQFPLDFVWISSDGRIADLTENVPHPALAGETLSGISPSVPVQYVLELNAGVIASAGLEIGDPVRFEPEILGSGS